ncbi:MAG: rhodanese-like domain-containing protein [Dehalococcoidia bacterium]|nr:MAG: rhodanese-like domain-containing protein [Dehalococcoidia bacterium]
MMARIIVILVTLGAICVVPLVAGCAPTATPQPTEEAPATGPDAPEEEQTVAASAQPLACAGGDLSPQEAYELLGGAALPNGVVTAIDTRGPEYYTTGHIPGAILISTVMPDFWDKIRALPRDAAYLVYCHRGSVSSSVVSQMMKKEGFTQACNMSGGFNRWRNDGLPTEEGDG